MSCVVGRVNRLEALGVIPAVAFGDDVVMAVIRAREAEVRVVIVNELLEVGGDVTIVSDIVTGNTTDVVGEVAKGTVELFEDEGLGLNFADELSHNLLRVFLKHEETLLDNFDLLGMADELVLVNYIHFLKMTRVVVDAIEVVETPQTFMTTPKLKRLRAGSETGEQRSSRNTRNQSGNSEKTSKFGEHIDA